MTAPSLRFDDPNLLVKLETLTPSEIDELKFGVIGFGRDPDACVLHYSHYESERSGLKPASVVGLPLFAVVAQCMNNYLVAQRFEDAAADSSVLDAALDYVLTLRMRPTPVTLRLLAAPNSKMRYVIIHWPK